MWGGAQEGLAEERPPERGGRGALSTVRREAAWELMLGPPAAASRSAVSHSL